MPNFPSEIWTRIFAFTRLVYHQKILYTINKVAYSAATYDPSGKHLQTAMFAMTVSRNGTLDAWRIANTLSSYNPTSIYLFADGTDARVAILQYCFRAWKTTKYAQTTSLYIFGLIFHFWSDESVAHLNVLFDNGLCPVRLLNYWKYTGNIRDDALIRTDDQLALEKFTFIRDVISRLHALGRITSPLEHFGFYKRAWIDDLSETHPVIAVLNEIESIVMT